MKVVISPRLAACKDAVDFVNLLPETFDNSGKTVFSGRNTIKVFKVEWGGKAQEVCVKRFKRPNAAQKIAYTFFRTTKAQRAFENAHELIRRGFDTPEPMAYVRTTRCGLVDYCYYVSATDYNPPIKEQLNDPEEFSKEVAAGFARFAARLHENGILDIDLNSTNVLYSMQSDGTCHFSLIDINRMRFMPEGCKLPIGECMENLTRFTGRYDLFRYVAERYVECRSLPAETVEQLVNVKKIHDEKWRRRKSMLKIFK